MTLFSQTHSHAPFLLLFQKLLPPTQLALWMGPSQTSSSHPLGEGGGKYRADTGHGPLEHLGPAGQHWFLEGRLCTPASLFPAHTGPHWLRIWGVRRTKKGERRSLVLTPGIGLSFGFSPLHPLKHWTWA